MLAVCAASRCCGEKASGWKNRALAVGAKVGGGAASGAERSSWRGAVALLESLGWPSMYILPRYRPQAAAVLDFLDAAELPLRRGEPAGDESAL